MSQEPMNDNLSGASVPFQDVYDMVRQRLEESRRAEQEEWTTNTMQRFPGLAALQGTTSGPTSEEQGSKRYAVAALTCLACAEAGNARCMIPVQGKGIQACQACMEAKRACRWPACSAEAEGASSIVNVDTTVNDESSHPPTEAATRKRKRSRDRARLNRGRAKAVDWSVSSDDAADDAADDLSGSPQERRRALLTTGLRRLRRVNEKLRRLNKFGRQLMDELDRMRPALWQAETQETESSHALGEALDRYFEMANRAMGSWPDEDAEMETPEEPEEEYQMGE